MQTSVESGLYRKLNEQLHRHWQSVLEDANHEVLTFPPAAYDKVAQTLFSNLEVGGFATQIVSGRRVWDPQNYYYESARRAAKRGLKITRAFLLPHKQYLKEELLKYHWKLDQQAGIDVKFLYVGDLLSSMQTTPPFSLDFGIWDDQLVCLTASHQLMNDGNPTEWLISSRKEDVELVNSLREELLSESVTLPDPDVDSKLLDLEEPMVKTAPLMDLLSNAVCAGSYLGEDCSWYHGVWQYLRILDLVSTPTWHPDFYVQQLRLLAEERNNARVLISGTADYSTLAHVLWAFDEVQKECDVTVLDLCQAPLIICRWYSHQVNHRVITVQDDIRKHAPDTNYDAIVTDAFLTRFSRSERPEIIKSWFRMLKPGGKVITTVRINDKPNEEKAIVKPIEVSMFRNRALKLAERWKDFLPIAPREIANKAQTYAEHITSYPILSENELRNCFEEQSFSTVEIRLNPVKGEMKPTTYAQIVARK